MKIVVLGNLVFNPLPLFGRMTCGLVPNSTQCARLAGLPGVTPLLEVGYRLFLPIRPYLSKAFGTLKS